MPQTVVSGSKWTRLQLGSPAIDAASASVLVTDHDYVGLPRPQGAAKDIGAFERAP